MMLNTRNLGLTTYRKSFEDKSQLHHSDPALEVGKLDDDVLEAIQKLGEEYAENPDYCFTAEGIGLTIDNRNTLASMPALDYCLTRRPMNKTGYELLCAFARQTHKDLHETQVPNYVRVIFSGPQSSREEVVPLIWHTDALVPPGSHSISQMTANVPESKRWVVGTMVDGSPYEFGNTEWLKGDFIIDEPHPVPESPRNYSDIFWDKPHEKARVTLDGRSILRLAIDGKEPDPSLINKLPDGIIGEIGTTTVHRGVLGSTALRVSMQVYFTQS